MEESLSRVFEEHANGAHEMEAKEFMRALNAAFHTGMLCFLAFSCSLLIVISSLSKFIEISWP